jgi:hypothetical protein
MAQSDDTAEFDKRYGHLPQQHEGYDRMPSMPGETHQPQSPPDAGHYGYAPQSSPRAPITSEAQMPDYQSPQQQSYEPAPPASASSPYRNEQPQTQPAAGYYPAQQPPSQQYEPAGQPDLASYQSEQHYGYGYQASPPPQQQMHSEEVPSGYPGHNAQYSGYNDQVMYREQPDGAYSDPEDTGRSGLLTVIAASLGVLLIAAGAAYMYFFAGSSGSGTGSSEPPVIKADNSTIKVKPQDSGGREFPNADKKVFDRLGGGQSAEENTRIMPRSEDEITNLRKNAERAAEELDATVKSTRAGDDTAQREFQRLLEGGGVQEAPNAVTARTTNTNAASNVPEQNPATGGGAIVRKVKTMVVRPDGSIVSKPVQTGMQAVSDAMAGAAGTVAPPVLTSPATNEGNVIPRTKTSLQPVPTKKQVLLAPPVSSQFVVQVAARRTHTDALEAFADLQLKYGHLLGGYAPFIQRADLGDRGVFYRLRVGAMDDHATAAKLCSDLKTSGLADCLVRRK